MAKSSYVWGIDVGQCALKALRCRVEGDDLVADAFDFIEYPKILSQPEADPDELIDAALQQFLSRNELKGCRFAMSVAGQSGLAKFFKPPPVDEKRIPDIVRYEARQQIPFPLDEVIWDFQKMVGGQEVDGFAIDAEVGLFAMKREQVHRALAPFQRRDVEIDIIQLAPISLYNFITYDLLTDLPEPDSFDPDSPPESIVVISMGTDSTDLVITNGFRVWQRSIPIGGNHFTKQLTKTMKLTFAKAEHLKRNARQAEDPKTVFQAMRPVFNDVVTEVQRSIGYFQGIDRNAKIRGVVLLGNTVKLPGLQQYVAKNLGYEVIKLDSFQRLTGSSVVSAPAFVDNQLAFGTCYGLCIQGLKQAHLSTNLLPPEIKSRRMVRAKKPWAVASISTLMLALAFNFIFNYSVWSRVHPERPQGELSWNQAQTRVESVMLKQRQFTSNHKKQLQDLNLLIGIGQEVVGAGDRRLLWLELLKAIDQALPWADGFEPREYVDFKTLPIEKRPQLFIETIESEHFADFTKWFKGEVPKKHRDLVRHLEGRGILVASEEEEEEEADPFAAPVEDDELTEAPKRRPGWVIELSGYHYYRDLTSRGADRTRSGADHVRNTLLKNLETGSVQLPIDSRGTLKSFTMKELGISYPLLSHDSATYTKETVDNPDYRAGDSISEDNPATFQVDKFSFSVQFWWEEKLLGERLRQAKKEAEEQEQKDAEAE